jgi:acyl-coenzyme A thioesterase PaaI-like protein
VDPRSPADRSFAAVTELVPLAPGRFAATVDARWTIGGKPNGGYLLALLGRAAVAAATHPHVISASTAYLHSPAPGPVLVTAEVLRSGRSATHVRVGMRQDDRACVEALIIVGTLDPAAEPYWGNGAPELNPGDRDRAIRVPGMNPAGVHVAIMDEVDVRLDRESLGFGVGQPSGRGELWGWLELPHGELVDPVSLLFAVDALPPATFDIEMTGWVPTLELTAYVRALPAPGPLRLVQRAHLIDAQRVDESCWVWDSRGRVVAQATQLAGIRLG